VHLRVVDTLRKFFPCHTRPPCLPGHIVTNGMGGLQVRVGKGRLFSIRLNIKQHEHIVPNQVIGFTVVVYPEILAIE